MGSGHLNVLLRSRRQFLQFYLPPLLNLLELDVKRRPFAATIHIPQVNNVALDSDKLHKVRIDVGADMFGNQSRNIQRANA
ncbi:hypothetical protein [Altererythrobacter sp. Z27]|uniref:hypothetical protein n=1 Tax=Altererythrobacter sp. Z27 TaxID=3461147 RepID=UPI004043A779